MRKIFVLIFSLITLVSYSQEKKVALILGNGNYSEFFKPLRTPVNDAKAMNWSLQKLGYKTIMGVNLGHKEMSDSLSLFEKMAKGADVALFYYSGHGCYIGRGNNQRYYLVPSGEYVSSATMSADCYDFEAVEKAVEATGAKLKLLFVDACRSSLNGSKGGEWEEFSPNKVLNKKGEASGTAWFFGASETTPAFQGSGQFSVFTQVLLDYLDDSRYFSEVWGDVTRDVVNLRKDQVPFREVSKDFKDFKLNPDGFWVANTVKYGYETADIKVLPSTSIVKVNGESYDSDFQHKFYFNEKYEIEIEADGYESRNDLISITSNPGSRKSFTYNLTRLVPATIEIHCNVPDATVYVGNKMYGNVSNAISTYIGVKHLSVQKKGYYTKMVSLDVKPGANSLNIDLKKDLPWIIEEPNYDDIGVLTYHFSPKYQYGLRYMHGVPGLYGKFSIGAMLGFSAGSFSQMKTWGDNTYYSVTGLDIEINNNITIGGKPEEDPLESHKEYIDLSDYDYSDYVDPYNEAKHYEVNTLMLAQAGFSPINGFMVDLGLGAAYHRDKYWMKIPYRIKKTWTTNKLTGEVSEPTYEYEKHGSTKMYKNDGEWSLALRLGASLMIPVSNDGRIVVGGGYTHLPHNKDFSSWDACLGFCWDF